MSTDRTYPMSSEMRALCDVVDEIFPDKLTLWKMSWRIVFVMKFVV